MIPPDLIVNLHKEIDRLKTENAELKRRLAEREGWQLVPKEPTARMYLEGENVMHLGPRIVYKVMLSTAPNQKEKSK